MDTTMMYNLRVTPLSGMDVLDDIRDMLERHARSYVVCREVASEMHYHVAFHSASSRQALNIYLRRKCGDKIGKANAGAAFNEEKIRDEDALHRYLCKGEGPGQLPDIVMFSLLVPDRQAWIQQKHDEYWQEHDRLKRKRKADRKQPMTEMMNDWADQCGLVRYAEFRKAASREYIRICVEQNRPMNVFHGKAVVNLVCAKRFEEAKEAFEDKLMEM